MACDSNVPPLWRISVATIEKTSTFSDFTGYDRTFVALDRDVMLRIDDRSIAVKRLAPCAFGGESRVACELDGPRAHDLNIMTLRGACAHRLTVCGDTIDVAIVCADRTSPQENAVCTIAGITQMPLTVMVRFDEQFKSALRLLPFRWTPS
ncbi:MAG: HutD family protein [Candidatus Eremiobacteraeota bacterium]|nr:HutD family protein [Candidatus Eremiobacteraeota bacterium]